MNQIISAKDAKNSFRYLHKQKRNVGIWIEAEIGQFEFWYELQQEHIEFKYINLLEDLLPKIAESNMKPFGVYDTTDFNEWIRLQAVNLDNPTGLICNQVDALLGTFNENSAGDFFRLASNFYYVKPIVYVTKLKNLVMNTRFPSDRVWRMVD